jgi:hypothetical protein
MKTGRVNASVRGIVAAPASVVWDILTDWGGFPTRAGFPNVEKVILTGGGPGVPLTRTLSFAGGVVVAEELIDQDPATRRLYCRTINNGGPWSNYLATLFVDEIDSEQCRIGIEGHCDAADAARVEEIKSFIESSWEDGIIAGVRRCLVAEGAQVAT